MEPIPAVGRTVTAAPLHRSSEMSAPAPILTGPSPRSLVTVSLGFAVATVGVQIAHPLLSGAVLRGATIMSVLLFTAASLTHAAADHGPAAATRVLVVAGGTGLAAEAVGVATGVPFGAYRYAGTLGPQVLGVPLLVPLAWTMMAYPCLLLGRRLSLLLGRRATLGAVGAGAAAAGRAAPVVLGAAALAAWDLFLDPQMVADGHWTWTDPRPALPGVPGVPLTNYAGWGLVALIILAILDRAVPPSTGASPSPATRPAAAAVPALLLGWTWLGSAVGNLAFFDRPAVAGYGALALGVTVLPYLLAVRSDLSSRPDRARRADGQVLR